MKCMRLRVSKLRVEGLLILGLKCRWFEVYGLRILPKEATSGGSTCHRDASHTVVWEPPTAKPKPQNP